MKAKFWGVFLACFLVFGVVPASALAGSISGTVTNAETDLPMSGVTVCAGGSCIGVPASGEYTIGGLGTGEYRVSFQPEFDSNYVRQYYPGTIYYSDATVISLDASEDVTGIDAAIEEGATISGTVVGEGGVGPVEEIEVCAEELGGALYAYCEHTDSDGAYGISAVPAGHYRISFQRGGADVNYATQYYDGKYFEGEADEVELAAGEQFTADATMVRSGAIEGVVTEDGRPVEWPSVCIYTLAEVEVGCTTGNEDGEYHYGGLPPGQYVLELERFGQALLYSGGAATFAGATPVTVQPESTAVEDFELHGPPGISGTVRDAATGEAPAGSVSACASSDSGTWCWQINWDGTYEMSGLEPGEYLVYFEGGNYLDQYYDGVSDEKDATLVTVGNSMVTGIDGELQTAGTLTGRVTAAATGANLSVEACLLDQAGAVLSCGTSSSKTGNYKFESVAPGKYKVRFKKSGYGTQYYDGKATLAAADPVTITGGQVTSGIDAAMVVPPANTVKPQLTGVAKVGEALTCTEGTWTGSPTSYQYSWLRGTTRITGAEGSTYTVAAADAGQTLHCGVTAESLGGRASAESSNSLQIPAVHQLSVAGSGDGSGTVTSSPAGIECGATCVVGFEEGATITLTAVADRGSEFTGWSGGGCSGTGTCQVTLGQDTSVVAGFAAKPSSAAPTTPPPTPTTPTTPAPGKVTKKPLQCKKGFRKVKRKGKVRCVKAPSGKKAKAKGRGKRG